jgi:hypothetical protein
MNRKQAKLNRDLSKKEGKEYYYGETCRFCSGSKRWTIRSKCCVCYTKTGIPKDFEKRKQQLIAKVKAQAKMKVIEFNISKDDIDWVIICPIMQFKIDYYTSEFRKYNTASFDRKDPSKGYIKGNVFIISNIANMRKSDLSIEQLERMINYVKESPLR